MPSVLKNQVFLISFLILSLVACSGSSTESPDGSDGPGLDTPEGPIEPETGDSDEDRSETDPEEEEGGESGISSFLGKLSVGHFHACWLDADQKLSCVGYDGSAGRTTLRTRPINFQTTQFNWIASGFDHNCALLASPSSGRTNLACWGGNRYRQAQLHSFETIDTQYGQVSVGDQFTCALRETATADKSNLICWGKNDARQTVLPSRFQTSQFVAVSAGARHVCAILSDEESTGLSTNVICWGDNSEGQVNIVDGYGDYAQISSGFTHTCGVLKTAPTDGTSNVKCWGDIKELNTTTNFSWVASGLNFSCAIEAATNQAYCWGLNSHGQIDVPADHEEATFVAISTGKTLSCGLIETGTSYKNVCWGEAGSPEEDSEPEPEPVETRDYYEFETVSTYGLYTNCGLLTEPIAGSNLQCFGASRPSGGRGFPEDLRGYMYRQVQTNRAHTCVLLESPLPEGFTNNLACWDENGFEEAIRPLPERLGVIEFGDILQSDSGLVTCALQARPTPENTNLKCWQTGVSASTGEVIREELLIPAEYRGLNFLAKNFIQRESERNRLLFCGLLEERLPGSSNLVCWYYEESSQEVIPSTPDFSENYFYNTSPRTIRTPFAGFGSYRFISLDSPNSPHKLCGITETGEILCWDSFDEEIIDSFLPSAFETNIFISFNFSAAIRGGSHNYCGLLYDPPAGSSNAVVQLNTDDGSYAGIPPRYADRQFTQIQCGGNRACGLLADRDPEDFSNFVCWQPGLDGSFSITEGIDPYISYISR